MAGKINIFKFGRKLVEAGKRGVDSLIPPKNLQEPYMQNTRQKASFDQRQAAITEKRQEAFTKQIILGTGVVGAGTVLSRRGGSETPAPVRAKPTKKVTVAATPSKPRKTLMDYATPEPSKSATSKPSKKSYSGSKRKSDSRLGGFSGVSRGRFKSTSKDPVKDTRATPRGVVSNYELPNKDWLKNLAKKESIAPAPAPRKTVEKTASKKPVKIIQAQELTKADRELMSGSTTREKIKEVAGSPISLQKPTLGFGDVRSYFQKALKRNEKKRKEIYGR